MEAAMTYIHYGSDHFDPALFVPVRNGGLEYGSRSKPADGTGLQASREGDPDGWEAWCWGARFRLDALNQSFRFTMPGAKILLLEDPEQLIALPKLHPWEPKKLLWLNSIKPGEIPTKEQLEQLYMPNWCYLDFEKLAEDYDAIELQNHWFFNSSLATWDCNCILVLKADKVVEI